jgi:hypothetical protein
MRTLSLWPDARHAPMWHACCCSMTATSVHHHHCLFLAPLNHLRRRQIIYYYCFPNPDITFSRSTSFGRFHQLLAPLSPLLLLLDPLHPTIDQRGDRSDRFENRWRHGRSRNIQWSGYWDADGRSSGRPLPPSERVQSLNAKLQIGMNIRVLYDDDGP